MSHVGLPVVRHDAYVMRERSACRAKSLSVTHHDCDTRELFLCCCCCVVVFVLLLFVGSSLLLSSCRRCCCPVVVLLLL